MSVEEGLDQFGEGQRWGVWCVELNYWDGVSFRCWLDESTARYLAAAFAGPDIPHRPHYEARVFTDDMAYLLEHDLPGDEA